MFELSHRRGMRRSRDQGGDRGFWLDDQRVKFGQYGFGYQRLIGYLVHQFVPQDSAKRFCDLKRAL